MPQIVNPEISSIFKERLKVNAPPSGPRRNAGEIFVIVAILVLAIIGVSRVLLAKPPDKGTVTVVGAAADLAPGSKIYFNSLHYIEVPQRYLTNSMFTSSEQVVGRILRNYAPQGEPITADDLFRAKNSISNNLETHERAITLRLDPDALVDNDLAPDDMVDIIATTAKDGKHFSKTICQNARVVLAMSRQSLESRTLRSGDGHRVTLAVGPEEAELISHAAETAKVRLVLRSRLSRRASPLPGVEDDDLLPHKAFIKAFTSLAPVSPPSFSIPLDKLPEAPLQATPPAPLPEPVKWVVEMFSGSRKELYAIPSQH